MQARVGEELHTVEYLVQSRVVNLSQGTRGMKWDSNLGTSGATM
jgi:hypothetical protein